jgi:glycosyltransferase 2 family protein
MATRVDRDGVSPMAEPSDCSATNPSADRRRLGLPGVLLWLCRGLAVLLLANAALNLAAGTAAASPGAGVTQVAWGHVLCGPASPATAWAALRTWQPVALVLAALAWGLLTAGVLFLRPTAAAGLLLAALLLLLTLRSTGADLWSDLAAANPLLLLAGVLVYGFAIFVTVVRWRMLLAVQGIAVPLWALARLTLIGVFFNLAIPGAVSGDLVKMGYVTARAGDRQAESILTIVVDRLLGMLGLFIVATISILGTLPLLLGLGARYRPLQWAAATVLVGSCAGALGVLLVECRAALLRQPGLSRLVELGNRRLPARLCAMLRRLVAAVELYRDNRQVIVKATLLAVVVHSLLALDLCVLGRALGETALGLRHYVVTTSVANAVASIPLTPGGVGMRDQTTAAFLSAFQAQPAGKAGSIPVVLSLVLVFWALVGAVIFVRTPRRAPA